MSLRPQGGFLLAVASPHPPLRGTLSREEKVDIDPFSLEGEGGRRPDEGADYGALAEKETSLASTADELVASSVANLCDVISCMKVRDMTERMSRRLSPCPELLESRTLATLVFVLNGNAFAGASPSIQTQVAAADLARRGDRAIQLSYPNMNSVGAFDQLAGQIQQISRGQPIGLIGFSAGGTLALRLSQFSSLNVKAVLDFYGPPDLANWISQHRGDSHARHVLSNINGNQNFINAMSGPGTTTAYPVSAFGTQDTAVNAAPSAASFQHDFPGGRVFFYNGPHGVTIRACYAAYQDFLNHL